MKLEHSLPSPPTEELVKPSTISAKRHSSKSGKSTKPSHRTSKRASTSTAAHSHLHSPISPDSQSAHSVADSRHKRVWKACERCRMKKTKVGDKTHSLLGAPMRGRMKILILIYQCDGEFPCKRCKDDGLVCTAGVRKKTEFKQLPRG